MNRDDLKKKIRERIVELKNLARMDREKGYIHDANRTDARWHELEIVLTWFGQ